VSIAGKGPELRRSVYVSIEAKRYYKECSGGSICEHGRQKSGTRSWREYMKHRRLEWVYKDCRTEECYSV
jgi:hypothetical protein